MTTKLHKKPDCILCCLLALFALLMMAGCKDKELEMRLGTWTAENIHVGSTEIAKLEVSILDDASDEGDDVLLVGEERYRLAVVINGEEIADVGVMYYTNTLNCTFSWNGQEMALGGTLKEARETGPVYMDAHLRVIGGDMQSFMMEAK